MGAPSTSASAINPSCVDPAPVDGANSWVLGVHAQSEPLVIRLCSKDDACALYWANTYAG